MISRGKATCFLSAPRDTTPYYYDIRNSLERKGVRVLDLDTFALGAPISTALTSMIEEADIFVAVLPQESSSRGRIRDNLIFELGLAIGMRKQMLILRQKAHGCHRTSATCSLFGSAQKPRSDRLCRFSIAVGTRKGKIGASANIAVGQSAR